MPRKSYYLVAAKNEKSEALHFLRGNTLGLLQCKFRVTALLHYLDLKFDIPFRDFEHNIIDAYPLELFTWSKDSKWCLHYLYLQHLP